jgi:hypothetical protein
VTIEGLREKVSFSPVRGAAGLKGSGVVNVVFWLQEATKESKSWSLE